MSPAVLAYVLAALQALPYVMQAGVSVEQFAASTVAALQQMQAQNRDPTPEEWQAQNSLLTAALNNLSAKVNALPQLGA